MTSEERQQYAHEVIRAVYDQDPAEAQVSSADFHVLQKWMDQGVPLRVVLQAVDQKKAPPWRWRGFPKSNPVLYVRPIVEEEIERWRRALA